MSDKLSDPAEILAYYAAGYFPLYDLSNRFYWERLPIRAVIPITRESVARAQAMGRRAVRRFRIRRSAAIGRVIIDLQNPRVKENTWVRAEVVQIYRVLWEAGLLQTVEAYDLHTGGLAGAVLGIPFPGTFVAETMYGLQPDASKVCLCELIMDAAAAGYYMIDVQTPHDLHDRVPFGMSADGGARTPHPCIRLGEVTISLRDFLTLFRRAVRASFPGNLADWLAAGQALASSSRPLCDELREANLLHLAAAFRFLRPDGRLP